MSAAPVRAVPGEDGGRPEGPGRALLRRTSLFALLTLVAGCGARTEPSSGPIVHSEVKAAEDRANLCSTKEALATGLQAEYFSGTGMAGPAVLTRQEGPLDEPWPQRADTVQGQPQSARWRGWIRPRQAGLYRLRVDAADATITVSGQRLSGPGMETVAIEMQAGRYHPILIELPRLVVAPGPAQTPALRLKWTAPHGATYLVPKAALYPPSDTVAQAPSR